MRSRFVLRNHATRALHSVAAHAPPTSTHNESIVIHAGELAAHVDQTTGHSASGTSNACHATMHGRTSTEQDSIVKSAVNGLVVNVNPADARRAHQPMSRIPGTQTRRSKGRSRIWHTGHVARGDGHEQHARR